MSRIDPVVMRKRIESRLSDLNWSQRQASRKAGIDPSNLRKFLGGKTDRMHKRNLDAIADALMVSPAWIYGERTRKVSKMADNESLKHVSELARKLGTAEAILFMLVLQIKQQNWKEADRIANQAIDQVEFLKGKGLEELSTG